MSRNYFAWHIKKLQKGAIPGLSIHSEHRETAAKINLEIDTSRSNMNYDFIKSDLTIAQRIYKRVDEVRENSYIKKNSVYFHSHLLTLPGNYYEPITNSDGKISGFKNEERIKEYFSDCVDYFKERFGEKNVVSAVVHLDETRPHMHLFVVPVNIQDGLEKLQSSEVLGRPQMQEIHSQAPKFLRDRGHDVIRGPGKITRELNPEKLDIHEFKEKLKQDDQALTHIQQEFLENSNRKIQKMIEEAEEEIKKERMEARNDMENMKTQYQNIEKMTQTALNEMLELEEKFRRKQEIINNNNEIINNQNYKIASLYEREKEIEEQLEKSKKEIESKQEAICQLTKDILRIDQIIRERQRQLESWER